MVILIHRIAFSYDFLNDSVLYQMLNMKTVLIVTNPNATEQTTLILNKNGGKYAHTPEQTSQFTQNLSQ